jgi:hypothetical protein
VTGSKITLADARHAELTQAGKTLRAEILEPAGANFSVTPATPLTSAENANKGATILTATLPAAAAVSDARLVILITPVGDRWPAALSTPAVTSLAQW